MNKEKMDQESIEYLFLKIAAHYSQYLPSNERSLNFMKNEFLRELQQYEKELVFKNLTNHIHKSKFPPTVSELVQKQKKEESIFDRIPSVAETQARFKAEEERLALIPPKTEEDIKQIEHYKAEIRRILDEAERKRKNANRYNPYTD